MSEKASTTKPQKQLVSKEQYVRHIGKNLTLTGVSVLALAVGIPCLLICFCWGIGLFLQALEGHVPSDAWYWYLGLLMVTGGLMKIGLRTKKAVESSEAIVIVTHRNVHQLRDEDSLVRGSDLPPTEQQAELLRAVQTGQETPSEELLRPVAGDE